MLWKDLKARTFGNNVKQVLDADRTAKTPTCDLWQDSKGRHTADIFKPAQMKPGGANWLAPAWATALTDAATFSVKETTADIAKKGKFDVKARYFTPSGSPTTYRLFVVPHVDWLNYTLFTKLVKDTWNSSKGVKGVSCTVAIPGVDFTTNQFEGRETLDTKKVQLWAQKLGPLVEAGDWLGQVAQQKAGLLRIGMHPLGLYSTWISTSQVNDLIKEVTKNTRAASWRRMMPSSDQVNAYNDRLSANGVLARQRFTYFTPEQLPLKPGQDDLAEPRRPTDSFMGDSANNVSLLCGVPAASHTYLSLASLVGYDEVKLA